MNIHAAAATTAIRQLNAVCAERDVLASRVAELETALREGETLLTNYLVAGKFPPGSDCEAVRGIFRIALGAKAKRG